MNTTIEKATLDVYGDHLRVIWTGSVWEAPVNGTQHASARSAMRVELNAYLSSCGEDVNSESVQDDVERLLKNIETD